MAIMEIGMRRKVVVIIIPEYLLSITYRYAGYKYLWLVGRVMIVRSIDLE
jgi:hypothetical protein